MSTAGPFCACARLVVDGVHRGCEPPPAKVLSDGGVGRSTPQGGCWCAQPPGWFSESYRPLFGDQVRDFCGDFGVTSGGVAALCAGDVEVRDKVFESSTWAELVHLPLLVGVVAGCLDDLVPEVLP